MGKTLTSVCLISAVPLFAFASGLNEQVRIASQCEALFRKADVNRDGRIREYAVADYPAIAAGFSVPEVKHRGYLTPSEFVKLCFDSGKQQPST